jgi:hypothetical protein
MKLHYAHTIEGFFNLEDFNFYTHIVNTAPALAHFVEVGSYKGRSSSFMAVEIINSGKNIIFDCVDTWQGSEEHQKGQLFQDPDVVNGTLFNTFTSNMTPVAGSYRVRIGTSVEMAATYLDNSLDFVFIDAAHDYENVKADIIAWLPKIKVGGVISGHDYQHEPVRKAVYEILGTELLLIGSCWSRNKV